MDITTERIRIPVGGQQMGGYLARPKDGGARPAVLVFMEIFGINSHIRDVTERVAREGYVALAPDYFHRTGPGVEYGYDDAGMAGGMKLLMQLKADEMIADSKAALAKASPKHEVIVYPGADHGFFCDQRATYQKAAADDAWTRVKALFKSELK